MNRADSDELPPETPLEQVVELHGIDRLVTSWLGRSTAAAKLLSRAAGIALGGRARQVVAMAERADELRLEDAERLATYLKEGMGRHKGAMMKLGQMLGYVDLLELPAPARKLLATLHDQSPPLRAEVVERVLEDQLGAGSNQLFAAWEDVPFAAASIGQVHRARLHDGRAVAVKVQYPGIEDALRSDMRSIELMARVLNPVAGALDARAVAHELRDRFIEECDYEREGQMQTRMAELFAADEELHVPTVVPRYSSKRVLTTELFVGQRFVDFVSAATPAEKNRAGSAIFRAAFQSIFCHHLLNCDPHPGNYLFAEGRVALLDFGCMRAFPAAFVEAWKALIVAVLDEDLPRFADAVVAMGMVRPGQEKKFDFEYQLEISRYLYRPWLSHEPFRYDRRYVAESLRILVTDNPNRRLMSMPAELVFVNRLQWGLNSVLAALEAEADWAAIIYPLIGRD
jgi:predicted unusual protein kinase regulating ubiquinone biosynthesis (AarF/ABC1/UbiB family)